MQNEEKDRVPCKSLIEEDDDDDELGLSLAGSSTAHICKRVIFIGALATNEPGRLSMNDSLFTLL